jgi:hypothetical protein
MVSTKQITDAWKFERMLNEVLPYEETPPEAEFDCEPNLKSRDGTMRHDWGAYMRRQFEQDELNIQWKERQRIRSEFLQMINQVE